MPLAPEDRWEEQCPWRPRLRHHRLVPQGPAGDTGAHDTRAATRGRRTAATSPRDAGLRAPGWAGTGIPRDARLPPRAGIQANRAEPRGRNSGGVGRPHPRGWRHTRARGSVTTRVGAGMPTPCGKRRQERRRRHPPGQHPAAFAWARRWHGQGGTLGPPFPAWEGDAVATLRGG